MIQISGLNKSYGDQLLFDNAAFVLNRGERVGLVGRNGSGKSTLFKLILDEEHPESGNITCPKNYKIGRLEQHLKFTESTILAEACLGLSADERDEVYRGEIILSGLGFSEADMQRAPEEFSGGFQIRINLAKLLLSEPNLLLLDEPTNYLDIVSARWLATELRSWRNELIIITHDRAFMDSVTTHTAIIYRGSFKKLPGGTQKMFDAIVVEEEVYEKTRVNDDKKRKHMEQFINRFRAQASKAALVQSRMKALEKMTVRDELTEESTLDFRFAGKPFFGKMLMSAKDLTFGYDPSVPLVKDLSLSVGKADRIGIIGKNGRGKSTLLKLLAGELTPQTGEITPSQNTDVAYFGQTNIDRLTASNTVEEEIGSVHRDMHRTKVRGICGTMMFEGDSALKKINVLSGGERSRVLLGKIIATPSNLLLLDEPTNHLDMDSIESLKDAILEYDGGLIIVTHSELLLKELCTRLVIFQGDAPFVFEGGYEDFLKSIGWEDEEGFTKPSKVVETKPALVKPEKSADAQKTGNFTKQQNQKKLAALEKEIVELEQEEKKLKGELERVSLEGDGSPKEKANKIRDISVRLGEIVKLIEGKFEEIGEV